MRIAIVAGEKSGDYLGSEIIKSVKARIPDVRFSGLCGPLMQAQGATSIDKMEKISLFGLDGLLSSLGDILSIRKRLLQQFTARPPDIFIGIDVPDFNLGLERKLKQRGIPVVHVVSPTVWAWRTGRVNKIRKAVDKMLVLFPFEVDFYEQHGIAAEFIGHPMASEVKKWQIDDTVQKLVDSFAGRSIALLPGSRHSEVSRLAPVMLAAAQEMANQNESIQFLLPCANEKVTDYLQSIKAQIPDNVILLDGYSKDVLAATECSILASGTAALEAALFGKPMIVLYKVGWLSKAVFGRSVRVNYFSMPNHLVDNPPVVPELIQADATVQNLLCELNRLLNDSDYFNIMQNTLSAIRPVLTLNSGEIAAKAILDLGKNEYCRRR